VDEVTGKLDFNSRGQLLIMLHRFTELLKEKVKIDQLGPEDDLLT